MLVEDHLMLSVMMAFVFHYFSLKYYFTVMHQKNFKKSSAIQKISVTLSTVIIANLKGFCCFVVITIVTKILLIT